MKFPFNKALSEQEDTRSYGNDDIFMPFETSHPINDDLHSKSNIRTSSMEIEGSLGTTRRLLSSILDSPRRRLRITRISGKRPCLREVHGMTYSNTPTHLDHTSDEYNTDSIEDFDMKITAMSPERLPVERRQRNVLSWIHDEAPMDLIPKILAFAGPQKIAALSSLNKSWRRLCWTEPVWQTLCEDYGKWVPGKDSLPEGLHSSCSMELEYPADHEDRHTLVWHKYYCDNPIVPIDFKTIKAALRFVSSEESSKPTENHTRVQKRSVRILLHPGRHIISKQLLIQAKGNTVISMETLPRNGDTMIETLLKTPPQCSSAFPSTACMACSIATDATSHLTFTGSPASPTRIRDTIRNFLICRSTVDIVLEASCVDMDLFSGPPLRHGRATIILHTSCANEPVIRVQEGTLRLCQVDLVHSCHGTDIWNGNAALQVQPTLDQYHNPVRVVLPDLPPAAIIEDADIMSFSGRGIVSIDGGKSTIRNCFVHDCAATGIYIGGNGSSASIDHTDIVHNGHGNRRSKRGIGRGHSGVYLEQGVLSLSDCNVSQNSLTGISAISHQNASILVEDSDLQGNGTLQLELPPTGTQSRGKCVTKNNHIDSQGTGRRRSTVTPETLIHRNTVPSPMDFVPSRPLAELMGPHVVHPFMYVEM